MCQHHVQRHTRSFPGDAGERLHCLQHGWEKDLSRTSLCLTPPTDTHTHTRLKRLLFRSQLTAHTCSWWQWMTNVEMPQKTHGGQNSSEVDCASCHTWWVTVALETSHKFWLTNRCCPNYSQFIFLYAYERNPERQQSWWCALAITAGLSAYKCSDGSTVPARSLRHMAVGVWSGFHKRQVTVFINAEWRN